MFSEATFDMEVSACGRGLHTAALPCRVLCVGSNAICTSDHDTGGRSDHVDMTAHTQIHARTRTRQTLRSSAQVVVIASCMLMCALSLRQAAAQEYDCPRDEPEGGWKDVDPQTSYCCKTIDWYVSTIFSFVMTRSMDAEAELLA